MRFRLLRVKGAALGYPGRGAAPTPREGSFVPLDTHVAFGLSVLRTGRACGGALFKCDFACGGAPQTHLFCLCTETHTHLSQLQFYGTIRKIPTHVGTFCVQRCKDDSMVDQWSVTIPELSGKTERRVYVYLPEQALRRKNAR